MGYIRIFLVTAAILSSGAAWADCTTEMSSFNFEHNTLVTFESRIPIAKVNVACNRGILYDINLRMEENSKGVSNIYFIDSLETPSGRFSFDKVSGIGTGSVQQYVVYKWIPQDQRSNMVTGNLTISLSAY